MPNINPPLEEWKELNSKTFKCQIGLGYFEKESVELSFDFIPAAEEVKEHLEMCIDLDASLEGGVPEQLEDKVKKFDWDWSNPVFFDPVNMVALLQLQLRQAHYLTQGMVAYCDAFLEDVDVLAEPDPDILHPVSSFSQLRIRFSQIDLDVESLHQWMTAMGWDGQPGDPAKSFESFPIDISRPPEPFPRLLMETNGFEALREFYVTGALTDFTLVSGDGQELKVHRNVIAAACEVFRDMLTHETKEKQNGLCRIDNINFETMKLLVEVLYGFPVEEARMKLHCKNLYIAADVYQLLELKMNCATYLGESMELEKVVDLYKFAKYHQIEGLQQEIGRFVEQNYDEFLDSGGVIKVAEKIPRYSAEFFKLARG